MSKFTPAEMLAGRSKFSPRQILAFSGLTIAAGVAVIVAVWAAGTPIAFEAESGTLAGGAIIQSVTGQSGSGVVKFGAALPTPTVSPAAGCPPLPAYPDEQCTGSKGTLTVVSGGFTAGTAGQVVQDKQFSGQLNITADNVTVKNVKIVTSATYGILVTGHNVVIQDVTIVGSASTDVGLASTAGGTFTAYRLNVSGAGDGVRADSSKLYDSYVTTGTTTGPHHDTVMGYGRGWEIAHNYLFNPNDETSVASLSWDGETPSEGILRNNYLAGAGFTIYGGLPVGTGIQVLNNVFSVKYYPQCGSYGYLYPNQKPNVWSGNTWFDGPNAGKTIAE